MKLANLIRHFGDMMNIPPEELDTLDVDQLIQNALSKQQQHQVEARGGGGEIAGATTITITSVGDVEPMMAENE